MSLNTTPRTWVTDETVTAAEMNAEIRDGFTGIQAAWSDAWTPTYTGWTIGNAVVVARWTRVGKTIRGAFKATMGSTSTWTTTLKVSLPVTARDDNMPVGAIYLNDASGGAASRLPGSAVTTDSGTNVFFVCSGAATLVANTVPWTWAQSDILAFEFCYEAA